ncbi:MULTISPECIES: invasion associated locus B family protein [Roseomonadaceae]|uniref:Invasion associated locus B family protein n=1 Tax=Falsiroseomonas oleicola TaxID=2801474 RepID=A0ABS6H732_9PROT|nr:invasion associated locus B family protein [Roseomonas oleicola]MBU8544259.1 invasion associated locus B family protein [Roseomonas oleicola]
MMRMQDMMKGRRRWALASGLAGLLGAVLLWPLAGPVAQPAGRAPAVAPAAPAAPAAEGPERTSAQFGDWSVNCTGRAPARNCEMVMAVRDPPRQLAAALAIGRIARESPLRLVAQVPVNIRVAQPARLAMEGAEPLALPFQTCNRLGCFAEIELREEALRRLRARPADQPGRLEWRDAAGQEVALPISFRGFVAAADALGRELR